METTQETPSQTQTPAQSRGWGDLTTSEREELKALSLEVYGASSRVQKLIEKGYSKLVTETVTEYVPGKTKEDGTDEDGTTQEVQIPLLRTDGAKQWVCTHHTVESIRAEMLDRKVKLDAIRAIYKRQAEEAANKKKQEALAQAVHKELSGSAT